MAFVPPPSADVSAESQAPLESWKEIATYLGRSVRTVQRWEANEGLPVHRVHGSLGRVYADRKELDDWWTGRGSRLAAEPELPAVSQARNGWSRRVLWGLPALALVAGLAVAVVYWRSRPRSARPERLVVLPFLNLSGDPSQEYLSDGLTEELTTQLARPGRLAIIARTSAMKYKGEKAGLNQIGRELDVDYALEGSVLRIGDRVRVTAQLIRVSDESHLWAETYERDFRDVLVLQDEIVQSIARHTALRSTPEERIRVAGQARPQVDPEAYEAYLRGRFYVERGTPADMRKGIEDLKRAVTLAPTFAAAHAALAISYFEASNELIPPEEAIPKVRAFAARAIELDESLVEAHMAIAWLKILEWDVAGFEKETSRATRLNPSHAHAWLYHGLSLYGQGRGHEGLAEMERARTLDPLSVRITAKLGNLLAGAGMPERGLSECRRARELAPESALVHYCFAYAYHLMRKHDESAAAYRAAHDAGSSFAAVNLADNYAHSGKTTEARQILAEQQRIWSAGRPTYDFARVYVTLGEPEQAIAWLEKAYREHDAQLVGLKMDPCLASLRQDARFRELARRVGLPD